MKGVFDIIGPVMIGPSSSHTAGATRLGKIARAILGEEPSRVLVKLHGSFAKTGRGHGTDKAIAAGLLGFSSDDERIPEALNLAAAAGMKIEFVRKNLANAHPNTAVIEMIGKSGRQASVMGCSVGGGNIIVTRINGYQVELTGEYATLITIHEDRPGVVSHVTQVLAQEKINVAFMRVSRQERGAEALMILESDEPISRQAYDVVANIPAVEVAMLVLPS
ncbi:serine dehydratase beta chain [Lucifera butyrica]|uniref:L-serine deaminase n=1 Tax=Lucifera butyrica TaxID=1351585 RepID=A0A498R8U0_9FIRM|nr:L-serine ammonia-lyase, iron-sulfur-dependent subunit beta [Lucifera butyrica]VBB07350.1 serine dehydratase beta chain [Lucifera butyrica]